MPITPGTQLGPYEVLSAIGAGGMGEVYRARDTRLDRTVALKVLSAHLSRMPDLRERFEREARAVSSLNHPHICTLYDIGSQDGIDFLVMEYMEGETLASRLTKGPLPLDQALKTAVEIADALDKAHRQGVVHRDLKPSNIMLTKAGAKLMDFGLAKLKPAEESAGQPSKLPTDLTAEGTILGTLQYMSPEQLEGIESDARSDIFAFGAVLYEMLTGRRAFQGRSQSSIIAAIIHVEPPGVSTLQPMTPPAIERLVKICLAKSPDERWQTAHDLSLQLQWIAEGGSQAGIPAPVTARRRNRERLAWASLVFAGLLVLTLAVPATRHFLESEDADEVRFLVETPVMPNPWQITISPDGRKVAFVAAGAGGQNMLYVRPIDSLIARALPGTESALNPFWSPDSLHIGFGVANSKLKRVDASGGPPQSLCDLGSGFSGGTWNSEGAIVFSTQNLLHRVSAAGGVATPLTVPDPSRQEAIHLWPHFLPDGRHYLYLAWSTQPERRAIQIASLDSKESSVLMPAESQAAYAAPGFVLFQREGTLLAQPFDTKRLELAGEPVRLAEDIPFNPNNGRAAFAVSSGFEKSALVYRSDAGSPVPKLQLTWVDRTGKAIEKIGVPGGYQGPSLSPDEKRVAIHRHDGTGGDVWIVDTPGGKTSRSTFDASQENGSPIWAPDGNRIAFGSRRNGKWGIYVKAPNGGSEEKLYESDNIKMPMSWSKDGKVLMFWENDAKTNGDIWAIALTGDRKAFSVLQTPFNESHPQISPDGKWIAYNSNETGRSEIYIQSFPPDGGKWQISSNGGIFARWRPDGTELFYTETISFGKLMSATIKVSGSTVESSTPIALFETAYDNSAVRRHTGNWNTFAVSSDGRRFLIPRPESAPTTLPNSPITVVLNWTAALRKK